MLDGGRGILAAFAGLGALFWAFALGLSIASSDTQEQRYQPYRYAADKPAEIDPALPAQSDTTALQDRSPCEQPKGKDESDLCAQWKAANAAEDSAFWAKWGFWITSFGAIGLLVTIIQGRLGLERAADANKIAQRLGEAQVRCYLTIKSAHLGFVGGHPETVACCVSNSGQSPGVNVTWHTQLHTIYDQTGRGSDLIKGSVLDAVETIGAQSDHQFLSAPTNFRLSAADIEFLKSGEIGILGKFTAVGEDVFGRPVETQQNFIAVLSRPPRNEIIEMRAIGQRPDLTGKSIRRTANSDTRHRTKG